MIFEHRKAFRQHVKVCVDYIDVSFDIIRQKVETLSHYLPGFEMLTQLEVRVRQIVVDIQLPRLLQHLEHLQRLLILSVLQQFQSL